MSEQKEYIITDSDLDTLENMDQNDFVLNLLRMIRSRPHNPDAVKEIISHKRGCLTCHNPDCWIWQTADQNCWKSQKEHDDQVRSDVLDEMIKKINEYHPTTIRGSMFKLRVKKMVKSMRKGAP